MRKSYLCASFLALLSGCGFVDKYEESVHQMEPIYCYQSLGAVECLRQPYRRDDLRLVNYFGPHPSRTDAPERPKIRLFAPPPVAHWVKDPEPIPKPRIRMADLPKSVKTAGDDTPVADAPAKSGVPSHPDTADE